jgi:hypothetical protein
MWAFGMILGALVIALLIFSFAWGAPIFAVPIVIVGALALGLADFQRRRARGKDLSTLREEAKASKVDFTERDRRTMLSE